VKAAHRGTGSDACAHGARTIDDSIYAVASVTPERVRGDGEPEAQIFYTTGSLAPAAIGDL